MKLGLPSDKDLLNHALFQAAQSASEATVRISFDVSDKESLRRRAIRAAVADARESAQTLAEASGVVLGEIARIDYGFLEVHVASRFASYELADAVAEPTLPDIEPEALVAEENVTVVWTIS